MSRGILIILFCCMCGVCPLHAQVLEFPETPIVFFSSNKNAFQVIWNDSLFTSKGVGSPWELSSIRYEKGIDYTSLRNEFVPLSTTGGDFFVVGGCGLVYQLKGDSIVRIDNSFRHKNQNSGLYWVMRDTLYVTGGYGFFESTNITTFYDWDTKGWYHRKCRGDFPPDFSGGVALRGKEKSYYLYGRGEDIHGSRDIVSIRLLDHRRWEWKNLGEMELPWNVRNEPVLHFWKNNGHLARVGNALMDVDVDKNWVDIYRSDKFTGLVEIVENQKQLLLSRPNHQLSKYLIELVDKRQYLGPPIDQVVFIPSLQPKWGLIAIALVFLLVVLVAWFWIKYKANLSTKARAMEVHAVKAEFSKQELELLHFFFEVGESGFESAELNRFFDYGDPNFDTLKKRRDIKMRELRKKLSLITGISTDDVFLEKRLESDRRVKKLYLNPGIKRENAGISL